MSIIFMMGSLKHESVSFVQSIFEQTFSDVITEKMLGILMQRMYKQFVCKFSLYWKGNHEALEKLLYGKISVENNKSEDSHSSQWEYIHSSHTKDIIYVILWANDNVIKHSLCITLCRVER